MLPCQNLRKINRMNIDGDALYLFGAGGHAKVVMDAAKTQRKAVLGVFDDDHDKIGTFVSEAPVVGGREQLAKMTKEYFNLSLIVSIGDNYVRGSVATWLHDEGLKLSNLAHKYSCISDKTIIGEGA